MNSPLNAATSYSSGAQLQHLVLTSFNFLLCNILPITAPKKKTTKSSRTFLTVTFCFLPLTSLCHLIPSMSLPQCPPHWPEQHTTWVSIHPMDAYYSLFADFSSIPWLWAGETTSVITSMRKTESTLKCAWNSGGEGRAKLGKGKSRAPCIQEVLRDTSYH